MARLFGNEYSRKDLLARVGDISQVGGIRLITLDDGVERGVCAADFRTGSGLDFTVLIDRGMDISTATYQGQPLMWRSSTGDVSPAFYEESGSGWLRSYSGGLFATCGLTYAGAECVDQGKPLGLHGRVSNLPASRISMDSYWEGDSYVMWIEGRVRETVIFGENVELRRRITARLGEPRIWISDAVTNLGYQTTEHMILYHFNIGFPVVDEGSRLIAPVALFISRDEEFDSESEMRAGFAPPTLDWQERVHYLEMEEDSDGYVRAEMVNHGSNPGVYLKYLKRELPKFTYWKMAGMGTYLAAMEPANCWEQGRDKERERGTLQFLEPGETREYNLEVGVLDSASEID